MKSPRPAEPAAIQGKKLVPPSLLTCRGFDQVCALVIECENQISKLTELRRVSGNTEYTLPALSTASVAKMSSVFVFGPPSKTMCASQTVSVAGSAGAEWATHTW